MPRSLLHKCFIITSPDHAVRFPAEPRNQEICVRAKLGDHHGSALPASLGRGYVAKRNVRFSLTCNPLGPLGFDFSQQGPTTRPSVKRTADKALLLSDRI